MSSPIAVVTGANKGIGFEVARGLGDRGAIVYLGARQRAPASACGRGTAAQAAVKIVEMALAGTDGPNGVFVNDAGPVPW